MAGVACVVLTSSLNRSGGAVVSLLVALFVGVSASIPAAHVRVSWARAACIVTAGIVVAQLLFLIYWGYTSGYEDGYGVLFAIQLMAAEGLVTALVAVAALGLGFKMRGCKDHES